MSWSRCRMAITRTISRGEAWAGRLRGTRWPFSWRGICRPRRRGSRTKAKAEPSSISRFVPWLHRREVLRLRTPAVAGIATAEQKPAHFAQDDVRYKSDSADGGRGAKHISISRFAASYIEERFLDCVCRRLSQKTRQTKRQTGTLRSE